MEDSTAPMFVECFTERVPYAQYTAASAVRDAPSRPGLVTDSGGDIPGCGMVLPVPVRAAGRRQPWVCGWAVCEASVVGFSWRWDPGMGARGGRCQSWGLTVAFICCWLSLGFW